MAKARKEMLNEMEMPNLSAEEDAAMDLELDMDEGDELAEADMEADLETEGEMEEESPLAAYSDDDLIQEAIARGLIEEGDIDEDEEEGGEVIEAESVEITEEEELA